MVTRQGSRTRSKPFVILTLLEILTRIIHILVRILLILLEALKDHELLILRVRLVGNDVPVLHLAVLEHALAADLAPPPDDAARQLAALADDGAVHEQAPRQARPARDVAVGANHGLLDHALLLDRDVLRQQAVVLGHGAALRHARGVRDLGGVREGRSRGAADLLDRL